MGFDNDRIQRLVFDIETYALDDAARFVAPPNLEASRTPSNWKDPVKIAAESDFGLIL